MLTELLTEHLFHAILEGFRSISQTKWHDQKLKVTKMTMEGFLLYAIPPHSNLVVSQPKIYFGQESCSIHLIHHLINPRDWVPVLYGF